MNIQDQLRFNQLYERHLTELTLQGKSKKVFLITPDLQLFSVFQVSESI